MVTCQGAFSGCNAGLLHVFTLTFPQGASSFTYVKGLSTFSTDGETRSASTCIYNMMAAVKPF